MIMIAYIRPLLSKSLYAVKAALAPSPAAMTICWKPPVISPAA